MARKLQAVELLRKGLIPSEIAVRMGVSEATVVQYIRTQVGEGAIRFSDVYFSWSAAKRAALEEAAQQLKVAKYPNRDLLRQRGLSVDDVHFYRSIRRRRVFAGDLYEHLAEAELAVHDMVLNTLIGKFGNGESGFWRQGVPLAVRKRCHERREEDDEPSESPFQYTTLIELAEVIGKNWPVFQPVLPKAYTVNKQAVICDFARLNRIRNSVMHPVKRRRWTEDDFEFAKRFHTIFEPFRAT